MESADGIFPQESSPDFFRPGADRIAKIKKLVAEDLGTGPAGFRGQDIGKPRAFVKEQIPQPIKQSRALSQAGLSPSPLRLAPSITARLTCGRGDRQFGNFFECGRITDGSGLDSR